MRNPLAAVAALVIGLLAPLSHPPSVPSLFGLLAALTVLRMAAAGQVPSVPALPGDHSPIERSGP